MDLAFLIAHSGRTSVLGVLVGAAGGFSFAGTSSTLLHLLFSLGLFGVFLVSIVDSSFVPLPVPGLTDIMLVLYAAQHANPLLLVGIATAGSALGGFLSHQAGQSGGMAFIEKRTPPRIFKKVTRWMQSHAILAVALPAILPPPMPLSPFVLAAGALNMSRKKFMITFTSSRLARHSIAVWLGFHYGKHVLDFWKKFSTTWGTPILIFLWTGILISVSYAFWQLWKSARENRNKKRSQASAPVFTPAAPHSSERDSAQAATGLRSAN
jgi:membrane protein YqaA with SNARE-associated domain